jgi:hypothetical protein
MAIFISPGSMSWYSFVIPRPRGESMKTDTLFKGKGFMQFKPPRQLINHGFHGSDHLVSPVGKRHGIPEHGD